MTGMAYLNVFQTFIHLSTVIPVGTVGPMAARGERWPHS